jgi:aspartate-semialdehyde dehydrogenase
MKQFKVAVVGATGAVGREMIKMLESRSFPIESIKFLASQRSVGKTLTFNGKKYPVELLTKDSGKGVDIAIYSAGGGVSKEFAPYFAKDNCFVIDNSFKVHHRLYLKYNFLVSFYVLNISPSHINFYIV